MSEPIFSVWDKILMVLNFLQKSMMKKVQIKKILVNYLNFWWFWLSLGGLL